MSGALLCLAAALVVWPGRTAGQRLRGLGAVTARAPAVSPAVLLGPAPAAAAVLLLGAAVSTPLVAVLAAGCAAFAARAGQRRRRAARERDQLAGLVEGLGGLAAELLAGRPPEHAARVAGAACSDPAARGWLLAAVRDPPAPVAGEPSAAVAAALDRIGSAVRLSGRTGCSLAAVLAAVEDDLRARLRHERELRSATAAPRAGAALLAGLPLLGLAMGAGVGADPWGVLTRTGAGQVLLVAGVVLEAAGVAWSARLVRRALR